VCCSVLQCVAVCCSVMQRVLQCVLQWDTWYDLWHIAISMSLVTLHKNLPVVHEVSSRTNESWHTHTNESCHTHTNESCHTNTNESCHTNRNESCHTHECNQSGVELVHLKPANIDPGWVTWHESKIMLYESSDPNLGTLRGEAQKSLCVINKHLCHHTNPKSFCTNRKIHIHGVVSVSRIDSTIGLCCRSALWNREYSAKETYNLIDLTDHSHPILCEVRGTKEAYEWVCRPTHTARYLDCKVPRLQGT